MKKYILIQPNEDGNPIYWLEDKEIEDIMELKEDYGIKRFLEKVPENSNPNDWEEGDALLLEVEIKVPKPVKIVEKYEL